MKKNKIKPHTRSGKMQARPGSGAHSDHVSVHAKKPRRNIGSRKLWLDGVLVVFVGCFALVYLNSWLFRSSLSNMQTYPRAKVLGVSVGGLTSTQLIDKLGNIRDGFNAETVTLKNGDQKWAYSLSELGLSVDVEATSNAVWQLNNQGLTEKYRMLTSDVDHDVTPVVVINAKQCNGVLSGLSIAEVKPVSASLYFDNDIKINPDQSGIRYNAASTCQALIKQLAEGNMSAVVSLDVIAADISQSDLEVVLAQIRSLASNPLTLKSGSYVRTLTPQQLLTMLDISKVDSGIKVVWSPVKLDGLVKDIATMVNTYDNGQVLGVCQRLVSAGGDRLNADATRSIFEKLTTNSSRSYDLPVVHYESVIKNIQPVSGGSSGTVYLTFDDGMLYGNQIMNSASCYGVKMTFFEPGVRVGIDAAALRRAIAEGHSVQSHGYEHAMYDYGERSYSWQYDDINKSISAITSVTGIRPTYFRPPGGNRSSLTYDAAKANSVKLILWGATSSDSGNIGTSAICSNVVARAFSGASILMHSMRADTANAVPCVIEGLAARGFSMRALR